MPNGHGGIPRFGVPFLAAVLAGLSVWWARSVPYWIPQALTYVLASVFAWRLAYHITMWDVSEYGGAYASTEEKQKSIRHYLATAPFLIAAAITAVYLLIRWK